MKLTLNQEACIACGLCHTYLPDVFDYSDDGIVTFYNDAAFAETNDLDHATAAIRECPTHAILKAD
jgi:ferredoxin